MTTQTKDTDLAYLAGILDGEGSLSIIPVSGICHVLVISVANTCLRVLQLFQQEFGGAIYADRLVPKLDPSKGFRKRRYCWTLKNERASAVIQQLMPYMRIKPVQASIALEFEASRKASVTPADQRRFGRRDPATWDLHEGLRKRMMEENGAHPYKRAEMRSPGRYLQVGAAIPPKERIRCWRALNPERVVELARRSHAKHREKRNAQSKAWRLRNPERVKENNRRAYEKEREAKQQATKLETHETIQ